MVNIDFIMRGYWLFLYLTNHVILEILFFGDYYKDMAVLYT
jgi:hypothetical protein